MQNKYRIANNYGTAIFQGDMVKVVTGGGIERYADGDGGLILGVFNGCEYTDPTTGKPLFPTRIRVPSQPLTSKHS